MARRLVVEFMQRPLSPRGKVRGGVLVHYAFGAVFGAAYALLRESAPALRRPVGVIGFGVGAWVMGDDVIVPAFRLAAGPAAYPLKTHAYAIAAHLVFAAAAAAFYEATRPRSTAVRYALPRLLSVLARLASS